ncbi:hypothetical protein HKD37_05G013250 [Glycine soja]
MDINPLRMVLLLSYEKVKNKNNNLDKSKVEIKSTQRKSKECREEESKRKIYTGSATTRAYVQSPSNHRGKRKNQKNSQAVSPLNLLARGRRKNQKNSQAVSPLNILARGRRKKR